MDDGCVRIHKILDTRGRICPYIMIQVRDTLKKMRSGQILEVILNYKPSAIETIPNFCHRKGYLVEIIEGIDGMYRLLIKKEARSLTQNDY